MSSTITQLARQMNLHFTPLLVATSSHCTEATKQGPFLAIKAKFTNCNCRIRHLKLVLPIEYVQGNVVAQLYLGETLISTN